MNYPPPPGDVGYGGPPPPHLSQHNYPRSQPGPPGLMSNGNGGVWNDGYGPPPPGSSSDGSSVGGPSRMNNIHPSHQRQPLSHQTPPDMYYPPPSSSGPPPGSGWSSVHPGGPSKTTSGSGRPGTRGNQQQPDPSVKLEDLVSTDHVRRGGPTPVNAPGGGMTSVPLNPDGSRPATTAGLASSAAAADASGAQAGPSEFIKKLYKMLEEESAMYGRGIPPGHPRPEGAKRGSVGWGRGGSTFVVWDMNDFTTKILWVH